MMIDFLVRVVYRSATTLKRRLSTTIAVSTASMTLTLMPCAVLGAINGTQEKFEEVTVEAALIPQSIEKLPLAIDRLERDAVGKAQAQLGLDESLTSIPGLVLQNRFNFAQDLRVSIRGFGARAAFGIRGVKILVDGIPETLADGQGSVDSIDIGSIGNIEVIRGPASSLYGNASGGVILINSDFDRAENGVEVRVATGGDGYNKQQVSANGRAGDRDQLSYIASYSNLKVDGYRDHSEHENRLFNSRMRYRFADDSTLNLALSYTDQPVSNDPGGINAADLAANRRAARDRNVQLNAGEALDQTRLGLSYSRGIGEQGQLTISNYHSWRDFAGRIPLSSNGVINFNRYFAGGGIRYSHRADTALPTTTIIGIDYDRQDDDRKRFANNNGIAGNQVLNQNETVSSLGLYIQNHTELSEQWLLTAGLRFDEVRFEVDDKLASNSSDSRLEQLSPMIGSSFALTPALNLYATVSTSFETPTTTELALPDGTGLNTRLNPQEAINYEIGVKGLADSRHSYSLAIFQIDVDDEIIGLEDNLGRDIFVNAGESSRQGVELSLQSQLTTTLSASLAYTWSDFEFDRFIDANGNDFSGKQLPGLPNNQVHIELNYSNEAGMFASIETLYTDELPLNNANSQFTEESLVTDMRLGIRLERGSDEETIIIEPFMGISNLFNEDYLSNVRTNAFGSRFFEAAPDRNVYGGVTLRYQYR